MTVSQVRQIFTELLHKRPATPQEIAQKVSQVLRRNEEARIYHWYKQTGKVPPQKPRPGPPPGDP
jgi:hypothetical protein